MNCIIDGEKCIDVRFGSEYTHKQATGRVQWDTPFFCIFAINCSLSTQWRVFRSTSETCAFSFRAAGWNVFEHLAPTRRGWTAIRLIQYIFTNLFILFWAIAFYIYAFVPRLIGVQRTFLQGGDRKSKITVFRLKELGPV